MPNLLTRFLILTLSALAFATLILTNWSYRQILQADLSKDGTNWACLDVRDCAVLFAYVAADAAPQLRSIKPPTLYLDCVQAYSDKVQEKATWPQEDVLIKQLYDTHRGTVRDCYYGDQRPVPPEVLLANDKLHESAEAKRRLTRENDLLQKKHDHRLFVTNWVNRVCKPKSVAGFFIHTQSPPRELVLRIPLPALALLFGLLPSLSFTSYLRARARRKHQNLCLNCGYNLTANTTGRCPECGAPVPPVAPKPI